MKKSFRPYAAEFVGTFVLALVVRLALTMSLSTTLFMAGLALGLAVYTIGGISGAHCNPAITFAVWTVRKIRTKDAIFYILAQFLGAALALHTAQWLTPGVQLSVIADNTLVVGLCEAIGAAILAWAVSSAVWEKTPAAAAGITVGTGLTLGIAVASSGSNGVLNPAVAVAIGSISPMYLLAPFVGTTVAAWGYKWIAR